MSSKEPTLWNQTEQQMGDILLLGYNGFLFPLFSSTMIMAFMGISATSGTKLNVNVASLASFAATKLEQQMRDILNVAMPVLE